MFFARVFRLFAYRGAMRQELEVEQRNNDEHDDGPPAPSNTAPHADTADTTWVSPDEMKTLFPDLF